MRASPARWRQRPRVSFFQFLTQGLLDFSSSTGCDQELLGNSFWYPEPHYESPAATWKHSDYSLLVAGEAVIAHRIEPPGPRPLSLLPPLQKLSPTQLLPQLESCWPGWLPAWCGKQDAGAGGGQSAPSCGQQPSNPPLPPTHAPSLIPKVFWRGWG